MVKVTFRMDTNESALTYFETEEEAMEFVLLLTPGTWRMSYLPN